MRNILKNLNPLLIVLTMAAVAVRPVMVYAQSDSLRTQCPSALNLLSSGPQAGKGFISANSNPSASVFHIIQKESVTPDALIPCVSKEKLVLKPEPRRVSVVPFYGFFPSHPLVLRI